MGGTKPLRYNRDMGFVLVPPDQKKVEVKLLDYPNESDKGPYPVPDNVPIEGWPANYNRYYAKRDPKFKGLTREDVQRAKANQGGGRHPTVVDPVNPRLSE